MLGSKGDDGRVDARLIEAKGGYVSDVSMGDERRRKAYGGDRGRRPALLLHVSFSFIPSSHPCM